MSQTSGRADGTRWWPLFRPAYCFIYTRQMTLPMTARLMRFTAQAKL